MDDAGIYNAAAILLSYFYLGTNIFMNILVVGFGHTSKSAGTTRARSGGETKLLNMLPVWKQLSRNHLNYLTSNAYALALHDELSGIKTIGLEKKYDWSRFGIFCLSIRRIFAVRSIVISEIPDLIYCTSDIFFDVIPSIILKRRYPKVKLVSCIFLVAQNPFSGYKSGTSISVKIMMRSLAYFCLQYFSFILLRKYADSVLVLNEGDKRQLITKGFTSNSIYVTSGGVDVKEIESVPKSKKVYDAVFLGRFHPQKGLLDLPQIWKNVTGILPGKTLAVFGGGDRDLQNTLEQQLRKNDLNVVVDVLTHRSRKEILSFVKSARIFIFPSHYESWGFVIAEAMACGLPVVAYELPYMKSIFSEGIITVPCYDTQKFSLAVTRLLSQHSLHKNMSHAAKQQATRYDWKQVAYREYQLFMDLTA